MLGNEASQELLMGQTSGMEDWSGLLSERFLQQGAYFVPAGEYDWSASGCRTTRRSSRSPTTPDAWHPDDALMVAAALRRRRAARRSCPSTSRRPAAARPPIELELLSAVAAHAGRRGRAGADGRARAPPPRGGRAPAGRVGEADRAPDGGGGARRGLLGHRARRSASTRWWPSSPRRASSCRCRGVGFTTRARRRFPLVAGRGARAAARPRAHAPRLHRSWSATWRRARARLPRRLLVGLQRARAARPGTTTGSSCPVRLGRPARSG